MLRKMGSLAVCGFALVACARPGYCTTIISTAANVNTGYTVSNNDLLQTNLLSTAASPSPASFQTEGVQGVAALTDGGFGPQGGAGANPPGMAAATAGNGQSITYTLDTSINSLGYFIDNVNTYAGWDGARYAQKYDLSFHIVGTTVGTFTSPISVDYEPTGLGLASNNDTRVLISDSTGRIASGVDQVKFTFSNADLVPAGGYQGYRELDVLGVAVPEPSSFILCALGAIGLFVVARRRRKA